MNALKDKKRREDSERNRESEKESKTERGRGRLQDKKRDKSLLSI